MVVSFLGRVYFIGLDSRPVVPGNGVAQLEGRRCWTKKAGIQRLGDPPGEEGCPFPAFLNFLFDLH